MKKKMQRFLVFFFAVVMAVAVIPFAVPSTVVEASASSATYSKEYYYSSGMNFMTSFAVASIRTGSSKTPLTDNGYSISGDYGSTDIDLNESAGGYYIRMGYKVGTSESSAIRGIAFYDGSNPPSTFTYNGIVYKCCNVGWSKTKLTGSASSTSSPLDLNENAGGAYIYLFYTTDPNAGAPMTNIDYETDSTTNDSGSVCQIPAVWLNGSMVGQVANLNEGAGGKSIYFFYKQTGTEVDTSALHSAITTADNLLANSSRYTSETVTALQNAVNAAKPIVNDYNADGLSCNYDQAAIDTAKNNINKAIDELCTMIYFDGNGGTVSLASTPITIGGNSTWTYNGDYSGFNATRTGYTFRGWSTSPNTSYTDTSNYFPHGGSSISGGYNTTFYAVWEGNKYNVLFDNLIDVNKWNTEAAGNGVISNFGNGGFTFTSNEGVGEATSESPYFPVTPGKQYKIDIDITGNAWDVYIFFCDANGNWIDFADGPTNRYSAGASTGIPADNAVFTAPNKAEVVKAKIRVDANGSSNTVTFKNIKVYEQGTVEDGISFTSSQLATYDSAYGTLPTPTKDGYRFLGWYDANGNQVTASTVMNSTETVYLTSKWEPNNVTITFEYASGSKVTQEVTYGSVINAPSNTTKASDATNHYTYIWENVPETATGNITIKEVLVTEAHNWSEWKTDKAPTCTADGSRSRYCTDCGYTAAEVVPATGHTPGEPQKLDIIQGSCTVDASYTEVIKCSVCGTEISRKEIVTPAPGHTWGDWVTTTNPTCTEAGENTRQCSVCFTNETQPVNALGHNYAAEWTVDVKPTCTAEGSESRHCSRCDSTTDVKPVAKLPHTDGEAVTENASAADCENDGKYDTVTYCSVCNTETSRVTTTVPALGHTWGDWVTTAQPDCENDGTKERECSVCSEKEDGIVDALGHEFSTEWTVDVPASCTAVGSKSHHCSRCEAKSDVTEIPMEDHTSGDVVVENNVNPDCVTPGSYENVTYCTVCNAETSRVKVDVPALGHTDGAVVKENIVAATCTTAGSHDDVTYCTVCGAQTSRVKVTDPATGHKAGSVVIENTKAPTCTADGSHDEVTYCTVCGVETSRSTVTDPATGHTAADAVVENYKDSTCAKEGSYDTVVYCSVCDAELSRKTEAIALKEHTPAAAVVEKFVDSTCAKEGSYDEVVYCSVCNAELSRASKTVALKEHTPAEAVIENNVAPDCDDEGSYDTVVYCSACKTHVISRVTTTVPALGHKEGNPVTENAKDPDCVSNGSYDTVVYCSVCNAELSRVTTIVDALGHKSGTPVIENPVDADCVNAGSYETVTYCTVCNEETSRVKTTVPALGHTNGTPVEENRNEPDCENAGSYEEVVYCTVCGDEVSRVTKTIDALGHNYSTEWTIDTPATCTKDGSKSYHCSRCDSKKDVTVIPATGHTNAPAVKENVTNATCGSSGYYEEVVYCSVCDEEISRTPVTVPSTGAHVYAKELERENPTCTADGYVILACGCSDDEFIRETLPATGHTAADAVVENNVAPDCDDTGSYEEVVYCKTCNAELSRNTVIVDALGHKEGASVTENNIAPDCDDTGSYDTVVYCTVCKEELSRVPATVPALGHKSGAPVIENNIAPDCENDGSYDTVVYCSVCKTHEISRVPTTVPALGHTAGAAVIENNVAPDCENAGSYDTVVKCTVCGKELSRVTTTVDALGHKAQVLPAKGATCTEEGLTEGSKCSACGETLVPQEIVPATGHTPAAAVKEKVVNATCTSTGSYDEVVYCSVCGAEISRKSVTVDKLPHTPGAEFQENIVSATCTADGSYDMVTECTVCEAETARRTVVVPMLGHNNGAPTTEKNVPATCTTDGSYDTVVYCTRCNTETSRVTTVVPALGHTDGDPVEENRNEPDCENDGSYETVIYCKTCGAEISRETTVIPALGHAWSSWVTTEEPTCTTDGEEQRECSVCHKIETSVIPQLGHDYADTWTVDIPASCTAEGSESRHCSRCDSKADVREIKKLPHTSGEIIVENNVAPDCENDGSYDNATYCTVCGTETSRETITVPATGHTAKDAVKENVVEVTCTTDGSYDEVVYCGTCGDVISRKTTVVPATGHTAKDAVKENIVPATCTAGGSYDEVVYCGTCGEEISREAITVPAIPHTPSDAVRENESFGSCLEGGSYDSVIYCADCGHEISRQYIVVEEGNHTPSSAVIENKVNATCTTPSSYDLVVYCKVCGDEVSRETIIGSTIAHKSDKAVKENYVVATCTTPGTYDQVVYCKVCGEEISRVTIDVGAKGHTIVADPAVNPTCTQDGKTLGSHCTACGVVIVMQETVPAPGHTEVDDFGYEPECTKTGLSYGSHCKKCGVVIIAQEVLPALGHTDLDGDGICDLDGRDVEDMDPNFGIVVNPDADGDGYIDANECEDCGREHINFFSSIICFFIRIMRLFGYKIT